MSWASAINTENCFERYAFDHSFAPTPRRMLQRSYSSTAVPIQNNQAPRLSRTQSASPASKRSFFKPSRRRSNPTLQARASISAPVLISSTNPLVVVKHGDITLAASPEKNTSRASVQISEILAYYENDENYEEDEDEGMETEQIEEEIHVTSLSPTPPRIHKPLPCVPSLSDRRSNASQLSRIQIQSPEPRSRFSAWSLSSEDDSSCSSSPTDPTFSRRESITSVMTDSTSFSISPTPESFDYNPYISKVATRGFQ